MSNGARVQFCSLKLPSIADCRFTMSDNGDELKNLTSINIFIGGNSTGKSILLRGLFGSDFEYFSTRRLNGQTLGEEVGKISEDVRQYIATKISSMPHLEADFGKLYDIVSESPQLLTPSMITDYRNAGVSILNKLKNGKNRDALGYLEGVVKLLNYYEEHITKVRRYYVPMIRGMRPLDESATDFYKTRTIADYFPRSSLPSTCEIHTGLGMYKDIRRRLLGDRKERDAVRDFETFLSKEFFDDQSVTLTPREGEGHDQVSLLIGTEEYPISHHGDGFQNLLILTYWMFMDKEGGLFYLEEPDLCMHPGLQRALMRAMMNQSQHQYFLTTHSNHLLDMTFDYENVSIYLFRRLPGQGEGTSFEVSEVSTGDYSVLREIGARNASVFLTNATIWIEGVTDRLYLRAYLKKYLDGNDEAGKRFGKFREDTHYSFVEYGGANLPHWTFSNGDDRDNDLRPVDVERLCGQAFLLADGDRHEKAIVERCREQLTEARFHILDCKEIENLIPEDVLRRIFEGERWHSEIRWEDYFKASVGLGQYLDELRTGKKWKALEPDERKYGAPSGTLKPHWKRKVSRLVLDELEGAKSLPEPVQELCEKIFRHIEIQNE